ncbi:hypothetical protein DPMN_149079 [Dreissena polymorpha]|uniref:SRCR domain-containing protein n=1 Tax=Dreissena polymorpha TaxID=45954 RepID=A0A9D4FD38_DREPO|nr:hypothetical protein DPMN_149079 [Dreissena polymorpha]
MRLAGSNAKDQGRVEILMNSQWGTICDDNFGPAEAAVVCGSLGFSRLVKHMCAFDKLTMDLFAHNLAVLKDFVYNYP